MHIEGISRTLLSIEPSLLIGLAGISTILLALAIWLAAPWLIAFFGQERLIAQLKQFERNGATVFNSILLPDKKGETTHISHLVITNGSITVIERLGYSGDIYGSLRDALWTQSNKGQHRFPNPVRNHDAIRTTLQGILGTEMRIRTITVFTAGKLHIQQSPYVIPSKAFDQVTEQLLQEKASGPKQAWASNLLRNIILQDKEAEQSILSTANEMQGDPRHLKASGYLLACCATFMLCAIMLAAGRMAASIGIL